MTSKPSPLETIYRVGRELVSSLDLHMVLARVLVLTTESIGAERASLVVLDQDGKPLDAAIIFDGALISSTLTQMEDILHSGLAGWVMRNQEAVMLPNTHEDSRWLVKTGIHQEADMPKSVVCVPLLARKRLVGILTVVHPQVNFFSEDQFKLQQAIADMAGIAIQNAQLYSEAQNARERYQDLFEGSIDPIFIADLGGRILECNQNALSVTGYTREELQNLDISSLHDPSNEVHNEILNKPGNSETVNYASVLRSKGDGKIPVEVYASRVTLQEKELVQWIFRDITEKVRLDKLREDLTAMIYHDLRSPLANIVSSIEILEEILPASQAPQVGQLIDISQRSAARMQRLISSLLDIDRLETEQGITLRTQVEVLQLINESIDAVLPLSRNKEIAIEELVPAVIPLLYIDEDMIRRVLINLLENACKFSPQKGKVSVGAKLNGKMVTMWVDDQGPGVPESARENIFEKFVRLEGENRPKGLGIGLAFCRLAVKAHGGKIWVENLTDGGSRFIFIVPAVDASSKKN